MSPPPPEEFFALNSKLAEKDRAPCHACGRPAEWLIKSLKRNIKAISESSYDSRFFCAEHASRLIKPKRVGNVRRP